MHKYNEKILTPNEIQPFLSEYLTDGYKNEEARLKQVRLGKNFVIGDLQIEKGFVSDNTEGYHLTLAMVNIWVSQISIIYGCWDNGLPRKEGEHFLREFYIKCKKEVTVYETEIKLEVITKKVKNPWVYYKMKFSVNNGAFEGTGSFVMPNPKEFGT